MVSKVSLRFSSLSLGFSSLSLEFPIVLTMFPQFNHHPLDSLYTLYIHSTCLYITQRGLYAATLLTLR
jgi:hypothetical protein